RLIAPSPLLPFSPSLFSASPRPSSPRLSSPRPRVSAPSSPRLSFPELHLCCGEDCLFVYSVVSQNVELFDQQRAFRQILVAEHALSSSVAARGSDRLDASAVGAPSNAERRA